MNEPEPGTGAPASVDLAPPPPEVSECKLVSGGRWKGYAIERPLPEGPGQCFEAVKLDVMESVLVRAVRVGDATEWRRGAWQRLSELEEVAIVGALEAVEEEGWRYEVTRRPPGATLVDWFACHKAGYDTVEALIRQLAAVLGALHAQGVVHLNLRPDTVYVDASEEALRISVGGLHEATLYTQAGVELADVDPLYAPPEAAGRMRHPPGTALCAWDWWSVGRIVQQFLLGRHVAALLKPEAVKDSTVLRHVAEQLLLEREPPGMRAGAVEAMGLIDPVIKVLLQGLLTSARDARWSGDEVRRWLARETVRVHYELPTGARLFVWKGKGFTLAAAAEYFVREDHWDDGEANLFTPEDPASLVHFLRQEPSQAASLALLDMQIGWVDLPDWADVPPAARRTVAAAVAWLALARSEGQRASLTLRGRTIDGEGLTSLFEGICASDSVALARALIEPHFIDRLVPLDPDAATVLSGMATVGGDAQKQAVSAGWVDASDEEAYVRLLCLALETKASLTARVERLRSQYASCRDAELARLLGAQATPAWVQVVLAYTGERVSHFGYITHSQWKREQLTVLDERSGRIEAALFWRRLRQILRGCVVTGSSWRLIGVFATVVLLIGGVVAERPLVSILTAGLITGARWMGVALIGRCVTRMDPTATPWTLHDGPDRCRREAERLYPSAAGIVELRGERAKIEAARLALGPAAPLAPPWVDFGRLCMATATATLAVVALTGYLAFTAAPRIGGCFDDRSGDRSLADETRLAVFADAPSAEMVGRLNAEADLSSGKFEYVDDGFGRRLRGPLQPWTLVSPPAPVAPLPVESVKPASAWQTAHALVSLELLLLPYARDAVHALIAVRVPTIDGGSELMVLNSRNRRPLDANALRLRHALDEQTWYQYDGKRVIFLGEPPALDGEISLAPP